jgi:hypothetical protein
VKGRPFRFYRNAYNVWHIPATDFDTWKERKEAALNMILHLGKPGFTLHAAICLFHAVSGGAMIFLRQGQKRSRPENEPAL